MKTWLQKRIDKLSGRIGFETERLLLSFNEQVVGLMSETKVTRSELARRIGVDRSKITRNLSGDQNMTVWTMVAMATALDCQVDVTLRQKVSLQTELFGDRALATSLETVSMQVGSLSPDLLLLTSATNDLLANQRRADNIYEYAAVA